MVYKLSFFSLLFEGSAVWLLFANSHDAALIWQYLGLHALASTGFALAGMLLAPQRYRAQKTALLALLFAFNFFVPFISLAAEVIGLVLYRIVPHTERSSKFATVATPRFTTARSHGGTGFRGGQARSQLGDTRAPLDQRLQALIAVQDTPVRAIGPMLRNLLADPADDLRLLAYGILDAKEKSITRAIVEKRQLLETRLDQATLFDTCKGIAELYWELIYQNLVQGDMLVFSNEQARTYAARALAIDENDAGLWFIVARLQLQRSNVMAALKSLQQAQRLGFPKERLTPYFAELEFLQHRYPRVRELMQQTGADVPAAFTGAQRFWLRGREAA